MARGADKRLQVAHAAPPDDVEFFGLVPGGPYIAEGPVIDGAIPGPDGPGAPAAGHRLPDAWSIPVR